MTDKELQLIEKMADKLGTTANHLWDVLIRQAPVYAATYIFYGVILAVLGYILYRKHIKFSTDIGDSKHWNHYDENESVSAIMVTLLIIWGTLSLFWMFFLYTAINAMFNPEYWALDKILSSLGG